MIDLGVLDSRNGNLVREGAFLLAHSRRDRCRGDAVDTRFVQGAQDEHERDREEPDGVGESALMRQSSCWSRAIRIKDKPEEDGSDGRLGVPVDLSVQDPGNADETRNWEPCISVIL